MEREEYYEECLADCFMEHGVECDVDKIKLIAKTVYDASQMEAESFGDLDIPNPMNAELETVKKELILAQEAAEKEFRILSDGVLKAGGRNPSDYYLAIEYGRIAISDRLR